MNACFCNGIQNPPTWRVFLLEWVAVLRVEWVAGLVSLQVEGFDRYVWLSWGGIRRRTSLGAKSINSIRLPRSAASKAYARMNFTRSASKS
jgi:hypothetical protein